MIAVLAAAAIGLQTTFITHPKQGEIYLPDAVAASAYDAAKHDPAAFCAAFRLVAYMQIDRDWSERWRPEADIAQFNSEALVCPRDLGKAPHWEKRQ